MQTAGCSLFCSSVSSLDGSRGVSARKSTGSLSGGPADIANMYRFLVTDRKISLHKITMDGKDPTPASILADLASMFEQYTCSVVYYTGHGLNRTGDWCFEPQKGELQTVSFEDMLKTWDSRKTPADLREKQWLFIVMDSCFAGAWVNRLRTSGRANILIQAACRSNEWCYENGVNGGYFTNAYIDTSHENLSKPAELSLGLLAIVTIPIRLPGFAASLLSGGIVTDSSPCSTFSTNTLIHIGNGKTLWFFNDWEEIRQRRLWTRSYWTFGLF